MVSIYYCTKAKRKAKELPAENFATLLIDVDLNQLPLAHKDGGNVFSLSLSNYEKAIKILCKLGLPIFVPEWCPSIKWNILLDRFESKDSKLVSDARQQLFMAYLYTMYAIQKNELEQALQSGCAPNIMLSKFSQGSPVSLDDYAGKVIVTREKLLEYEPKAVLSRYIGNYAVPGHLDAVANSIFSLSVHNANITSFKNKKPERFIYLT